MAVLSLLRPVTVTMVLVVLLVHGLEESPDKIQGSFSNLMVYEESSTDSVSTIAGGGAHSPFRAVHPHCELECSSALPDCSHVHRAAARSAPQFACHGRRPLRRDDLPTAPLQNEVWLSHGQTTVVLLHYKLLSA